MDKPRDPIGFELFKNTLLSIADEMALTILRTAYSGVLKDNMDYSTAFCDGSGRTIAQGLTLPAHLSSFPDALAATIARFGDRMRPGDVYCLNDPFEGGMHIPDVFVLKPIFHEGERLAFAATICHQTDMGGRVAGSNASDSTEIYQEGLRIPPVKMYDAGEPNETLFRLLEKNIRMPARVFGDLRAQLAACHIAESAFLRLVARHGAKRVEAYMEEILDYTERLTRASLAELPDGEWSFEDWIDDDGIDYGKPIRLFVTLRKKGDSLVADWTGTSPQVKGAINNTASFTRAATFTCLKSVLAHDVLCNAGFYRAIDVIAPPGTIANGVLPAASAARGLTGFRMLDTCFGALAQMLPAAVDRRLRGRQHRRVDRRLLPRPSAVHLRRVHLLGVGRPRVGRRPRRQRQHARQHVAAARRDHRGGAATADPVHRVREGRRRPRQAPRGHVDPPRLQAPRRGGGAAGARRPTRRSALTDSTEAGPAGRPTTCSIRDRTRRSCPGSSR